MISIIYCTRKSNPEHTEHLYKSCGGKDIDIIEIINNGESLTKCYNRGLKQTKYDIVVFCHDDIIINTKNWGKKLKKQFEENPEYGIIGVAGSTEIGETGKWWEDKGLMVGFVKHSSNGKTWESRYSGLFHDEIIETVMVDGLFFAVDKNKLKYKFDESVEGFHFYDVDFCFGNHINGNKVGVGFNIKIIHKSIGETDDEWEKNRIGFIDKWKDNLPTSIKGRIICDTKPIKIKKEPKLAIIVLTKSNLDLLFSCLTSISEKTNYENYKIYIGDTGSTDLELSEIEAFIEDDDKVSLTEIGDYMFSKNNNQIANEIIDEDTQLLLFCNNDIELINDAISLLVRTYIKNKNTAGTIGARLHFYDNKIQHGGIYCRYSIKNKKVVINHFGIDSYYGYKNHNINVFGNTGAFLLINKYLFNSLGSFNEDYDICFEDVELSIKALLINKKNILVNDAVCYHKESATRGFDEGLTFDYYDKLLPLIDKNINKLRKDIIFVNND
ncbi:MAG: glycosyltransferase [Candidatus Hodarchaeales archaeon]